MLNIVHLPQREDRYASLMRELLEQNISAYKIWPGIKATYPWLGIRRAHQQIVLGARIHDTDFVTIAEDDIKFFGKGAYDHYLSQMPPPSEFDIYLGGIMDGEVGVDGAVVGGRFTGLTLYTVSNKFYNTFLAINSSGHLDGLLRGLGRYVVCDPMVVTQHGGYTDNLGRIVQSYDLKIQGRKIWKG